MFKQFDSFRRSSLFSKSIMGLALLFIASPVFAESIQHQVTHSISPPSTGKVGTNATVSWAPLPQYSHLSFSHVILGVKDPSGSWSYSNKSASGPYNFTPNQAGSWCFRVRGAYNGELGNYNSSQCMSVAPNDSILHKVTHSMSVPSSGTIFSNVTVGWSPLPAYSHLGFSHVILGVRNPSGSWSYSNRSASGPYTFLPSSPGTWCFRVRGGYNGELGNYTSNYCMNVSGSVAFQNTHSLTSVPSTAYALDNVTIAWAELSPYNLANFDFVELATRNPQGVWSYPQHTGSSTAFVPNKEGSWCFKVRGYANGGYGNYSAERCMSVSSRVKGQVTHQVTNFSGDYQGLPLRVSWSALPAFSGINFAYEKIYFKRPDGSTFDTNIGNVDYYEFTPQQIGDYCFKVRGYYDQFSYYGPWQCHNVKNRNLLGDGSFDGNDIKPWKDHRSFHVGNWFLQNGKITLTSPNKSAKRDFCVNFDPHEDPNNPSCVVGYPHSHTAQDEFNDACKNGTVSQSFRCRKSEISFNPNGYSDNSSVSNGGTSIYAYEFKINKMFDYEDCKIDPDENKVLSKNCYVFISQFHTGGTKDHLSPNNSVQVQYDPDFNKIELSVRSKVDCEAVACTGTILGDPGERYKIEDYDIEGSTVEIKENETYYLRHKIEWATDTSGSLLTCLKGPGTGNVFVKIAEAEGVQTTPIETPVTPQTGLYWGGLKASTLYPKGNNGNPMSVTLDNIWMAREESHLPSMYQLTGSELACANK